MNIINILTSPALIIILVIFLCGTIVHFRGKRRFTFFRQMLDHSTFMAPINVLMYALSKTPNKPFLELSQFRELNILTDHWETIKDEALSLQSEQHIKTSDKYNDIGFNSFFRRGWKRFYLKWYSKDFHSSAKEKCPKTIELIKKIPSIKAAMFVVLPSGSALPEHRDPYAGSLRYHLGLFTPNSENCFINVDNEKYYWKDGEAVLFDETYLHHAENNASSDRLIFFCDIRRPMITKLGVWLNSFFAWFIIAAAKSPNDANDQTGKLNRSFKYLYQFRLLGKRVKESNKGLYYLIKYLMFATVIFLLFYFLS